MQRHHLFISFCFFILGCGSLVALTSSEPSSYENWPPQFLKNQFHDFKTKECTVTIPDFTDIELEEDCNSDDYKASNVVLNPFLSHWEWNFSAVLVSIPPYCTPSSSISLRLQSLPIYLQNKVFRI